MIVVELPNGQEVEIDTDDEAVARRTAQRYWDRVRPRTPVEEATNAFRAANNFLTFGFGDEIEAAGQVAIEALSGQTQMGAIPQRFSTLREASEAEREGFKARRPLASAAAETVGGVATLPFAAAQTPGRVAQAARAGAQPLRDAMRAGAAYGALSGYASGDPNSTFGRAGDALVGAAAGAVAAPAIQGAVQAGGQVVELARGAVTRGRATPRQRAVRMVRKALDADGALKPGAPTQTGQGRTVLQERADQLPSQGGGVEELFGELGGKTTFGQMRAVANVPGPGQQIAADTLDARRQGMGARVLGEITRGQADPATEIIGNATTGRQAVKTSYDSANQIAEEVLIAPDSVRDLTARLDDFLYDLDGGAGLIPLDTSLTGLQRARAVIARFQELASSGRLSLRAAESIRKNLNRIYEGTGGDRADRYAVGQVLRFFDETVEATAGASASARDAMDALRAARRGFAALSQSDEALEAGRRAFNADDVSVQLWLINEGRGRTQSERDSFTTGVVSALANAIGRNDSTAINRFLRDEVMQKVVRNTLGPKQYRRIELRMRREARMQGNNNAIQSGSRTAPLQQDVREWTEGEDELGFIADLIQRDTSFRTAFMRWFLRTVDKRRPGIRNPNVNKELADILYGRATPDNVRQLLQEMSKDPQLATALRALAFQQGAVANQGAITRATARTISPEVADSP